MYHIPTHCCSRPLSPCMYHNLRVTKEIESYDTPFINEEECLSTPQLSDVNLSPIRCNDDNDRLISNLFPISPIRISTMDSLSSPQIPSYPHSTDQSNDYIHTESDDNKYNQNYPTSPENPTMGQLSEQIEQLLFTIQRNTQLLHQPQAITKNNNNHNNDHQKSYNYPNKNSPNKNLHRLPTTPGDRVVDQLVSIMNSLQPNSPSSSPINVLPLTPSNSSSSEPSYIPAMFLFSPIDSIQSPSGNNSPHQHHHNNIYNNNSPRDRTILTYHSPIRNRDDSLCTSTSFSVFPTTPLSTSRRSSLLMDIEQQQQLISTPIQQGDSLTQTQQRGWITPEQLQRTFLDWLSSKNYDLEHNNNTKKHHTNTITNNINIITTLPLPATTKPTMTDQLQQRPQVKKVIQTSPTFDENKYCPSSFKYNSKKIKRSPSRVPLADITNIVLKRESPTTGSVAGRSKKSIKSGETVSITKSNNKTTKINQPNPQNQKKKSIKGASLRMI